MFGYTTGNDSDDAGMPIRMRQNQCAVLLPLRIVRDEFLGLFEYAPFDGLPISIEFVKIRRQGIGPFDIAGREQLNRKTRLAESAGSIDARRESKRNVFRLQCDPIRQTRNAHQCL